jgi:hypothetical protein
MSIQAQRRHPGIPCAMVYGLYRALPGDRACLPPSPAGSPANLTPASGARTTRLCRPHRYRSSFDTACVHRIPRQRFVTTMIRPSVRARDGEAYRGVSGQTRSDIFLQPGLDMILLICPSGKSSSSFRGAKRSGASPESITTDACGQRHWRPQLRATSTFVVMDSGLDAYASPRNDEGGVRANASRNDDGKACAKRRIPRSAFGDFQLI